MHTTTCASIQKAVLGLVRGQWLCASMSPCAGGWGERSGWISSVVCLEIIMSVFNGCSWQPSCPESRHHLAEHFGRACMWYCQHEVTKPEAFCQHFTIKLPLFNRRLPAMVMSVCPSVCRVKRVHKNAKLYAI